jgi:hypothetical protein
MTLGLSITAIVLSIAVYVWALTQFKRVSVSLVQLVKAMDVLYSNQDKILELTKIKSFVQLVNEEDRNIKQEIGKEKTYIGSKKTEESIRPSNGNQDNKGS